MLSPLLLLLHDEAARLLLHVAGQSESGGSVSDLDHERTSLLR